MKIILMVVTGFILLFFCIFSAINVHDNNISFLFYLKNNIIYYIIAWVAFILIATGIYLEDKRETEKTEKETNEKLKIIEQMRITTKPSGTIYFNPIIIKTEEEIEKCNHCNSCNHINSTCILTPKAIEVDVFKYKCKRFELRDCKEAICEKCGKINPINDSVFGHWSKDGLSHYLQDHTYSYNCDCGFSWKYYHNNCGF